MWFESNNGALESKLEEAVKLARRGIIHTSSMAGLRSCLSWNTSKFGNPTPTLVVESIKHNKHKRKTERSKVRFEELQHLYIEDKLFRQISVHCLV